MQFEAIYPEVLERVCEIEQQAHSHPWSRKTIESCLHGRYFHRVLLHCGEPIGYFIAEKVADEATLMNISVAPHMQGQGLGLALANELISLCRAQDITQLFLEVRASNHSAIGLYLKLGFAEIARRKDYYPVDNGREDAIVMRLSLEETTRL